MFNQAYHQHHLESPNCPTNLHFNYQAEQQRGVCWIESLKCKYCTYRTQSSKLYEEMETGKQGPKTSQTKPICVGSPPGQPNYGKKSAGNFPCPQLPSTLRNLSTAECKQGRTHDHGDGLGGLTKREDSPERLH